MTQAIFEQIKEHFKFGKNIREFIKQPLLATATTKENTEEKFKIHKSITLFFFALGLITSVAFFTSNGKRIVSGQESDFDFDSCKIAVRDTLKGKVAPDELNSTVELISNIEKWKDARDGRIELARIVLYVCVGLLIMIFTFLFSTILFFFTNSPRVWLRAILNIIINFRKVGSKKYFQLMYNILYSFSIQVLILLLLEFVVGLLSSTISKFSLIDLVIFYFTFTIVPFFFYVRFLILKVKHIAPSVIFIGSLITFGGSVIIGIIMWGSILKPLVPSIDRFVFR